MHRSAMQRDSMRRSGGGGGAGPGTVGGGAQCFATLADLALFNTIADPDVCIAFVETVWDFYIHDAASVAAPDGITIIGALGGGNWLRQCVPAQKWADAYAGTTQQISTAGNDENTGLVGSPLRTAAEMERRLHGLNVEGAQIVNVTVGNLGAADPFRKTWTNQVGAQTGAFTLNGVRTLSVTGVTGAVTTTAHGTYDVTAALGAGSVNRLIEFLVGAGPAVRCTGWVAADLGAGVFRITQALDAAGVETAPVLGDTFNVYTLTEAVDVVDENDDSSQAGNRAVNVRVNNPGGGNFAQLAGFRFETCDINARAYFSRGLALQVFNNCRVVPPDTTYVGALAMFAGLVAVAPGGAAEMYLPGNGDASVAFAPSVTFQATQLRLDSMQVIGPARLSFFDNVAGTACLRTTGCRGVIDLLRGTGNISPGWQLIDPTNEFQVNNTPTLVTTGNELQIGATFGAFADLALTTIRDPHGHIIHGTGVAFIDDPSNVAYVVNDAGVACAPGDIARMTGTGVNTTFAQADSEANALAAGVLLNSVADNITAIMATSGPCWVRIAGTLPTVGQMVWLSPATAGQGTATMPVNGIVVEIGRALRTSGTRALVALNIQVIPQQLRTPLLTEEFLGGSTESGELGELNWSVTNGTAVRVLGAAGHPGVYRFTTNLVIGSVNEFRLSPFSGAQTAIRQDQWDWFSWVFEPVDVNADYDTRFGVMASSAANPPTDGVYVERLAADANYFFVTRAGGAETRTDTTIAYAANTWHTFRVVKSGANILLYIDGTLRATHAANIPAAATGLVPAVLQSTPGAAAARNMDVDFWQMQMLAQGR